MSTSERIWEAGRLWSYWDMKSWDGSGLSRAQIAFSSFSQALHEARIDNREYEIGGGDRANLIDLVQFLERLGTEHDFPVIAHAAGDLLPVLQGLPVTEKISLDRALQHQLQPRIDHLNRSIEGSLRGRSMFALTSKGHRLMSDTAPPFGQEVFDKFAAAQRDIVEAGKCLAVDRATAVVFHLMRALELTVRRMAAELNATIQNAQGQFLPWGVIVNNIGGKIDAMPDPAQKAAWSQVHGLLHRVNLAWRNPTMHPAASYTDEEAQDIYDASAAFMRKLAATLP